MVRVEGLRLNSDDVESLGGVVKVIREGEYKEFRNPGDGTVDRKLVLPVEFGDEKKTKRDYIPNNSSVSIISRNFGDDTQEWVGKKINLGLIERNVFGETKTVVMALKDSEPVDETGSGFPIK